MPLQRANYQAVTEVIFRSPNPLFCTFSLFCAG